MEYDLQLGGNPSIYLELRQGMQAELREDVQCVRSTHKSRQGFATKAKRKAARRERLYFSLWSRKLYLGECMIELQNVMLIKKGCGYCKKAQIVAERFKMNIDVVDLTDNKPLLESLSGRNTYPQIWIDGTHIGGCDDFLRYLENEEV